LISLLNPLNKLETYNSLINDIKTKATPVLATGVLEAQKSHLIFSLFNNLKVPIVVVTHSEVAAKEIYQDLSRFIQEGVKLYPSKDIIFYNADLKSAEIVTQRLNVINMLMKNENIVVVLSIEALLDKLIPKKIFEEYILNYSVGDKIDVVDLTTKLVRMGYERRSEVEYQGQFAVRGGIIDIFTTIESNPFRIELWDDQIDSIRLLDRASLRSLENISQVRIMPAREIIYDENAIENANLNIKREFNKTHTKYVKKGLIEESENLKENISKVVEMLKEGVNFSKLDNYINFFYEEAVSLTDYLNPDSLIIFDEPKRINEHVMFVLNEFKESIKHKITKGDILPTQCNMIFSYEDILQKCSSYRNVLFSGLTYSIKEFDIKGIVNFKIKSTATFKNQISSLLEDLKYFVTQKYQIRGNKTKL
jgi:transcription-repair coupling factor (superfamily II helicase)